MPLLKICPFIDQRVLRCYFEFSENVMDVRTFPCSCSGTFFSKATWLILFTAGVWSGAWLTTFRTMQCLDHDVWIDGRLAKPTADYVAARRSDQPSPQANELPTAHVSISSLATPSSRQTNRLATHSKHSNGSHIQLIQALSIGILITATCTNKTSRMLVNTSLSTWTKFTTANVIVFCTDHNVQNYQLTNKEGVVELGESFTSVQEQLGQIDWLLMVNEFTYVNGRLFEDYVSHLPWSELVCRRNSQPVSRYPAGPPVSGILLSRAMQMFANIGDEKETVFHRTLKSLDEVWKYFQEKVPGVCVEVSSLTAEHVPSDLGFSRGTVDALENILLGPLTSAELALSLHLYILINEQHRNFRKLNGLEQALERLETTSNPILHLTINNSSQTSKHTSWEWQNTTQWFQVIDDAPTRWMRSIDVSTIKVLGATIGRQLNAGRPAYRRYKGQLNYVHRRFKPGVGLDFILDFQLKIHGILFSEAARVHLAQPLGKWLFSPPLGEDLSATVHIILPVSSVGERFHLFMKDFEKVCLRMVENVRLVVVIFPDEDRHGSDEVERKVVKLRQSHPAARLKVVQVRGQFSRARALDSGALSLEMNSLLFFCDVDVDLSRSFLRRCRTNTVRGSRVFFPMLFTRYSPELVRIAETSGLVDSTETIHSERGHWFKHSYGMVCVYNSDYKAAGGFNLAIKGWGGEDVDLFERFLKKGYDLFRAPEPDLFHRWHAKQCHTSLSPTQLKMCRDSQVETVGSKRQLAIQLFLKKFQNEKKA